MATSRGDFYVAFTTLPVDRRGQGRETLEVHRRSGFVADVGVVRADAARAATANARK